MTNRSFRNNNAASLTRNYVDMTTWPVMAQNPCISAIKLKTSFTHPMVTHPMVNRPSSWSRQPHFLFSFVPPCWGQPIQKKKLGQAKSLRLSPVVPTALQPSLHKPPHGLTSFHSFPHLTNIQTATHPFAKCPKSQPPFSLTSIPQWSQQPCSLITQSCRLLLL